MSDLPSKRHREGGINVCDQDTREGKTNSYTTHHLKDYLNIEDLLELLLGPEVDRTLMTLVM